MFLFIGEILKGWWEKTLSRYTEERGRLFHTEEMLLHVSLTAGSWTFQNPLTPSSWRTNSRYCLQHQRRSQGSNWGLPFLGFTFWAVEHDQTSQLLKNLSWTEANSRWWLFKVHSVILEEQLPPTDSHLTFCSQWRRDKLKLPLTW